MKSLVLTFCLFSAFVMTAQTTDSITIKQVDSLILASRTLNEKREFDQALENIAIAEKIALDKLGRESATYGSCHFTRALIYETKGDFQESEKWYIEAKTIKEKVLGKENADYAYCINNLAGLYYQMGDYNKALPLYLEAKSIMQKIRGNDGPMYAKIVDNLGVVYSDMGDNEKAEPLYLEAKSIREKTLGKENVDYALSLNHLGTLYQSLGNYDKAETFYLESKSIREKLLGKDHPQYAWIMNNLAGLYIDMHNPKKAEAMYLESCSILKKIFGINSAEYAATAGNLADLYCQSGDYQKAEPLFLEVNSIQKNILGKEHPDYAISLANIAEMYNLMGDYKKAEPLYMEASSIFEKALGKENSYYTGCQNRIADVYEIQNKFSNTETVLLNLSKAYQERLSIAATFMSEQELAIYTSTFQEEVVKLNSYLLNRSIGGIPPSLMPELVYQNALFYKGFLLNEAVRSNKLAKASVKGSVIKDQLDSCRRKLSIQYSKPIDARVNIKELAEQANVLEKELTRVVAGYGEATRQLKWQDVEAVLKKDEAAIEFIHFQPTFPKIQDSVIYAALIIKSGFSTPQFIPLFEERSLDSLLHSKSDRKADYVNGLYTLADRGAVAVETPKRSLYEILWKPLEKNLEGIKTIYFSPGGLLYRINLDAIPISETETLSDKYQLIELNSTRQLVIPNEIKNVNNDAVLYGGIQFEQDSNLQKKEPLFASRSRGELLFNLVDSTLRGGSWNYLAGTEREVNSIEIIMQSSGLKVQLRKGYDATEESFKNIGVGNSATPKILHFATHGYFFPDPKEKVGSSQFTAGSQDPVFKISELPMLRSGLILAGGNATWQGKRTPEGKEDGILTAYEISQMNLSNTELVVLSACETGLGDIQGNEGVYGLQRAFKIAGAKYLIMSLWQVPDKQTSLLMTTFYKKWLKEKMTIPKAFHAAQKELRNAGLDPYQWAGFVLVE